MEVHLMSIMYMQCAVINHYYYVLLEIHLYCTTFIFNIYYFSYSMFFYVYHIL